MPASFAELAVLLRGSAPPIGIATRIIAVDGLGGAGKSTFAEALSGALDGAAIVHTDDFASWDEPLAWWPRLIEQVLRPLSIGQPARYQRYDWQARELAEWLPIDPAEFVIVEGVSSSRQAFCPYLSYTIWIETERAERLRRGLARDGEQAREQWAQWMAEEDRYLAQESPRSKADLVVSGTAKFS